MYLISYLRVVEATPLSTEDQFARWQREKKDAKKGASDLSGGSVDYDHQSAEALAQSEKEKEKAPITITNTTPQAESEAKNSPTKTQGETPSQPVCISFFLSLFVCFCLSFFGFK
jgi:hypothetical protein